MSDTVELADVPQLFERWLAGRPLADRSRREYARNVRVYCEWLAETQDRDGWQGDPLTDPLARDHAARDFRRDHRRHALCLQILVNAVQVWNARYMTASIDHLHATKHHIVTDETAVARVAPVTHAHVNSLGRYDLHRQPPPAGHLRPLRQGVDSNDQPS